MSERGETISLGIALFLVLGVLAIFVALIVSTCSDDSTPSNPVLSSPSPAPRLSRLRDPSRVQLDPLERPGLSISMPRWPVLADEPGIYEVGDQSDALAQVMWRPAPSFSAAEIEATLPDFVADLNMTLFGQQQVQLDHGIAFDVTAKASSESWLALTIIQCDGTWLRVTIGVSGGSSRVVELRDRLRESFSCADTGSARAVSAWPVTDLPDDFGVREDGEMLILAHADGRVLFINPGPSSIVAKIRADEIDRDIALDVFGDALETMLTPADTMREASTWTGGRTWILDLDTPEGPMVMSAFVCESEPRGVLVFARGVIERARLEALALHVGCPRSGDPSILARPDACAVEAEAYCNTVTIQLGRP